MGGEKGSLLTMIATKLWAVKVMRNKIVVNCVDIKRNVDDKGGGDRGARSAMGVTIVASLMANDYMIA